jgi:hypothetical protein
MNNTSRNIIGLSVKNSVSNSVNKPWWTSIVSSLRNFICSSISGSISNSSYKFKPNHTTLIKSREGYLFKYHHGNLLNKAVRQSQQTLVKINIMILVNNSISITSSVRNIIISYHINNYIPPYINIIKTLQS